MDDLCALRVARAHDSVQEAGPGKSHSFFSTFCLSFFLSFLGIRHKDSIS